MYWIISKKTNATLFTTDYENLANKVAKDFFSEDCYIAWADGQTGPESHRQYVPAAERD